MKNTQSKHDYTFSLWLTPTPNSSAPLQSTIDNLASKHSSLPFCPHMTVCSQLLGSVVELSSKLEDFAHENGPQYLTGRRFSYREIFYQSLFIELAKSEELRKFYKSALDIFEHIPSNEFYPHISLAYIDPQLFDAPAEIALLDADMLKETPYDHLCLMETSGQQKHWMKAHEIKLNDR